MHECLLLTQSGHCGIPTPSSTPVRTVTMLCLSGEAMRRRDFITIVGGAAVWPLAARARQPERVRRIGILLNAAADDAEFQAWVGAFLQALALLGWTIGRNVRKNDSSSNGRCRGCPAIGVLCRCVLETRPPLNFSSTSTAS